MEIALSSLYLLPHEEQNLDLQVLGTTRDLWQLGHSYSVYPKEKVLHFNILLTFLKTTSLIVIF